MNRSARVFAVLLMVLLIVPTSSAGAKQSLDVTIDVAVIDGEFEASGPAVAANLMCDSGTIDSIREKYAGPGRSPVVRNLQVITEFTCGPGDFEGDTFVIKQQLHIDLTAEPVSWTFSWVMKGGLGAFEDLHGNGDGTGVFLTDPFGPFDTLEGRLH